MSTGANHIGRPAYTAHSNPRGELGRTTKAIATPPAKRPGLLPQGRARMRGLILALGATAGLLALGVPAAQASTHSAGAPTAVAAAHASPTAISPVASNGSQKEWYWSSGPYAGCVLWVGDHYRTDGWAAGEADIKCPTPHTYRLKVYLDYLLTNGNLRTVEENTAGNPYYGYGYYDVWTGSYCGGGRYYWTTYASVSFDGGSYSPLYDSQPNKPYQPGAC